MVREELKREALGLSEEDRIELSNLLLDSLEGADPNDSDEDSLTEAKRRSEELWSGAVEGIGKDELLREIREARGR